MIRGKITQSKGEEPYRKVIISSTNPRRGGGRDFKRGGKGGNRRNGNGGRKGGRRPQSTGFDFTTSFEKEYKKPKPEDSMLGSGLYSKIDI